MVEATKICNLECPYCCLGKSRNSGTHMSIEAFIGVMRFLERWGADYIYFTGGEPFMNPEITEILVEARRTIERISVATNGLLLEDRHFKTLASILPEYISISFDNIYACQPKWQKEELRKLDAIARLAEDLVRVRVSVPVFSTEADSKKVEDLSVYLLSLGIPSVYLRFIESVPSETTSALSVDYDQRNHIENKQNHLWKTSGMVPVFQGIDTAHRSTKPRKKNICPGGEYICFVDSDAKFWPCSWLEKKDGINWGEIQVDGQCHGFEQARNRFMAELEHNTETRECPAVKMGAT